MKRFLVRFLLSLVIGGAMLYLASRQLSFRGTWTSLQEANWLVLLPYFALMALQHVFRVWRWGQLLAPIQPVAFARLLPIASVGYLATFALPLRMGEFVRPYLIADPPKLRLSHALGTLVVERVFDGLIVALMAFLGIAIAARRTQVPTWITVSGTIALIAFLLGLALAIVTLWQKQRTIELASRLFGLISQKLAQLVAHVVEGVVEGFRVLPHVRHLSLFLGATLLYWLLNILACWVFTRGFSLELGFFGSLSLLALIGVGIIIPAGPGFIGNWQLFGLAALALYVSPAELEAHGSAVVIGLHVVNALWYLGVGALSVFSPHISFSRVWRLSTTEPEGIKTPAAAAGPPRAEDAP